MTGILLLAAFARSLALWRQYRLEFALLLSFWAAMAFNVVVTYRNHGISASTGWYLCTLLSAFILVIAAGALHWRRWFALVTGVSFATISFYGDQFFPQSLRV